MNRELTAQGTQLLKPGSNVAHDCSNADHLPCIVRKRHDGELDRGPCAVLPDSGDREDLAVAVARLPGPHRGMIPLPMPLTQVFGDDKVKRTAECFCLSETKDARGGPVPQSDHALGVCIDDRIRHAGNETFGEICWVKLHDFLPAPAVECQYPVKTSIINWRSDRPCGS